MGFLLLCPHKRVMLCPQMAKKSHPGPSHLVTSPLIISEVASPLNIPTARIQFQYGNLGLYSDHGR